MAVRFPIFLSLLFLITTSAFAACDQQTLALVRKHGLGPTIAEYTKLKKRIQGEDDLAVHSMISDQLEKTNERLKTILGENLSEEKIDLIAERFEAAPPVKMEEETIEDLDSHGEKTIRREVIEWAEQTVESAEGMNRVTARSIWETASLLSVIHSEPEENMSGHKISQFAKEMGIRPLELVDQIRNIDEINSDPASKKQLIGTLSPIVDSRNKYRTVKKEYDQGMASLKRSPQWKRVPYGVGTIALGVLGFGGSVLFPLAMTRFGYSFETFFSAQALVVSGIAICAPVVWMGDVIKFLFELPDLSKYRHLDVPYPNLIEVKDE